MTWINAIERAIMPAGGATGQVLAKKSALDRDVEWVDQSGGGGGFSNIDGGVPTSIPVIGAAYDGGIP